MVLLLVKKTNGFKAAPLKCHQLAWFTQLRELLTVVVNTCYTCAESESFSYFAKRSLDHLLSIVENIKLIFAFSKETSPAGVTEDKKPSKQQESMLDHVVGYMQEGTDFSVEKLFETPHPYPKGEYA